MSCSKEITPVEQSADGNCITEITAGFAEGETRTVLGADGTSILWSPNDEISVFYDGDEMRFRGINTTPKAKTIFMSSGVFLYGGTETDSSDKDYLYAVYPYSYSSSNAQKGDTITLTVPAAQTAVEGSFQRGAYPSVGRSKTTDIAFYNVCGGLRFTLCQGGIRKIVLTGNNNETLAGKVKVQFDENGKPKVSAVVTGEKSITLTAPDTSGFQTGKWYYISALPTVLSEGYKVEFIKRADESERGTRTTSSSVEIKRSVFGSVENIDNDVTFGVGVASLTISPKVVFVAPLSVFQLSLTILPADATYKSIKWSSSDKTIASVDEDGMVVGKKEGTCIISATSDNGKADSCKVKVMVIPAGAVDLGLSVLWHQCNIGASSPEEYGTYFAWGDVKGQTWNGSSWSGGGFSSYPTYEVDSNNNLKPEYDAAHVILGGSWRMPTKAEFQELIDNCTSTWTSDYEGTGVAGRICTSKKTGYTDKSIFLPAAGRASSSYLYFAGSIGIYWSGTFSSDYYAWGLYFDSDSVYTSRYSRYYGQSVRPVSE